MLEIVEFLSGGVPGGILLFVLALLVVNLSVFLFKSSKLINAGTALKKSFQFTMVIFIVYIGLWFLLRPPLPQVRVVVLPSSEDGITTMLASSFELPQLLQQLSQSNLTERFIFHRWEWLLETIGSDSVQSADRWKKTGFALQPGILIESSRKENHWECVVYSMLDSETETKSWIIPFQGIDAVQKVNDEYDIFKEIRNEPGLHISGSRLQAKIEVALGNLESAVQEIEGDTSSYAQLIKAQIMVKKGLKLQIDREKAKYIKTKNLDFAKAKPILHSLRRKHFALSQIAYLLGRIAWREEDFNGADMYLKTALSFEPANPRIHYGLSFLHFTRFQELGYANRIELLEKAVYLDPGFRNAVYQLAGEYFSSGTGTQTGMGTTLAMRTIERFLKISHGDASILSLLGSIYVKIQKLDEALAVFLELQDKSPNDSNMIYNIGVVYFFKKEYQKALDYFLKAIELDGNLDSFLYAGLIFRQLGDDQKALDYYRERIRRKTGEDDQYAKEAMTGIRKILQDQESGNQE